MSKRSKKFQKFENALADTAVSALFLFFSSKFASVGADTGDRVRPLENIFHLHSLPDTGQFSWHRQPCQVPIFLFLSYFVSSFVTGLLLPIFHRLFAHELLAPLANIVQTYKSITYNTTKKIIRHISVGCIPRSASFNVAWLDNFSSFQTRWTTSIWPTSCSTL